MTGFADLVRERGEASVRSPNGDRAEVGATKPPADSEPSFTDRLPAGIRDRVREYQRGVDARHVSQEEIDAMTDDEKWQWAKDAIDAEHAAATREAAKAAEAAWREAQQQIGGTP